MNKNFPPAAAPIKLYRSPLSGHCHRVQLMLLFLDLPHEVIDLDLAAQQHKSPEFLKLSPFGLVPAIDDNGFTLSDSNAILVYLTRKYPTEHDWAPQDPARAAEIQRWLSIAAGEIASGPCSARLVAVFGAPLDHETSRRKSHALFKVMDPILAARPYLAGPEITIADVAGYTYIAHAPEGGVTLEPYPAIRAWLRRIEAQPHFVGMVASPIPELA
jgi:glutathione S-transferase